MDFYPGYAGKTPIFKADKNNLNKITEVVKELMKINKNLLDYEEHVRNLFKKYSGAKKTKLCDIFDNNFHKSLIKRDKKIKVNEIEVNSESDMLFIIINNKKILKIQIKDQLKRDYLHYFLDSLDIELLNIQKKKIIEALNNIEIDDLDAIRTVVEDLKDQDTKIDLKRKIDLLESKLDQRVFEIYGLNDEEIKYIEDSFF